MVIRKEEMRIQERENMRGGEGTIIITHLADKEQVPHARLLAKIEVPVGGFIGPHEHSGETEFFYVIDGKGEADDSGKKVHIETGDLLVTGGGAVHSVKNIGDKPLFLHAIIIVE